MIYNHLPAAFMLTGSSIGLAKHGTSAVASTPGGERVLGHRSYYCRSLPLAVYKTDRWYSRHMVDIVQTLVNAATSSLPAVLTKLVSKSPWIQKHTLTVRCLLHMRILALFLLQCYNLRYFSLYFEDAYFVSVAI
jgi:hypothetical protein